MKKKIKDGEFHWPLAISYFTFMLTFLVVVLLQSCSNEKHFVRFHDKQTEKAINYCRVWNPVHDSIHEQVYYEPGETQIIPGEVIYANCDSAYQAALDEAARLLQNGTKIIVKRVAVPCPPSTVRIDTVNHTEYVQVTNTGMEDLLRKQRDEWTVRAKGYLTWAEYEGIALGVLIILGAILLYANSKRA